MPKKKDENIVDDYYSNLPKEEKSKAKKVASTDSKPKVKVKKKTAPKKEAVVKAEEKTVKKPVKKAPKKPAPALREMTKTEKEDFNKSSTVKKTKPKPKANFKAKKDGDFKGEKKTFDRKPSDKKTFEKKGDFKKEWGFKKDNRSDKPNFKKSPSKTESNNSGGNVRPAKTQEVKKFDNNKPKFKPNKANAKKNKKFDKKKELEMEFSRSQTLMREKKEKSVDEMNQVLKSRSGETVKIPDVITVKELSEKIWVPITKLMAEFMKNGMMVNLNANIDFDTASIVTEAFDIKLEKEAGDGLSIDEIMDRDISSLLVEEDTSKLTTRPPVISIMGHVDHGKTSLLDHIRSSKVAEKEAGWITQSIWAYQVDVNGQKVTFLDTPGHEAFTVMRARGAKSTDIAILVVAADEWVKPQTIESISHAKEAGIPVIVAINKMDKEGANPDHVKGQLAEHGLTPDDWGGDTTMVPVSAKSGFGIDDLLETIVLVSEMEELKANPDRRAVATVVESHLDVKFGPVATILINTGKLHKTDCVVCSDSHGKVKVLRNHLHKNIDEALPGDPALIVGLDKVVEGWDILQVVPDVDTARKKAQEFAEVVKAKKAQSQSGLEILMARIKSGALKELKVVVKADTNGSLEAIKAALLKINNEQVRVSIAHSWVGNINESDVLMATASQTIVVWFNVGLVGAAETMINDNGVELINHRVIYHITERIEAIATWMLDPKEVEITLGQPVVKEMFYDGKKFTILWIALKEDDKIEKWAKVRVIRGDKMVGKWEIENLKQWVEDVNSLEGPLECWIQFKWDVKPIAKDILEVYKIEIQK